MRVITPPDITDEFERPAIFLGGGITGAPDWQLEAAKLLQPTFATCFNPRRAEGFVAPDHPEYLNRYREQVAWEHQYLLAADVVLFWMPGEAPAVTTRFEIGWWYGLNFQSRQDTAKKPFVVGIEEGVAGDTYYRVVLPASGVPVHNTLEATCERACTLLKRS